MFIIKYSIPVNVEFHREKYSNKIKCSHFNGLQLQIKKKFFCSVEFTET